MNYKECANCPSHALANLILELVRKENGSGKTRPATTSADGNVVSIAANMRDVGPNVHAQ